MGDLAKDTAVVQVDTEHFRADVSADWEIWGPMGGYIASIALRAVGATSSFRPASFFCQYLGVASFDTVDVTVTELRSADAPQPLIGRRSRRTGSGSWRPPSGRWATWRGSNTMSPPHHPCPGRTTSSRYRSSLPEANVEIGQPPFPFWNNFESKPLDFRVDWPPPEPLHPSWKEWNRFVPSATFEDPWVDACRSLILVDVQSWPAASRQHVEQPPRFYTPSLDLYVAFHDPQPQAEWLLSDGYAPVAVSGLMGWNGRLWSPDGRLVASGGGQLLCRRVPQAPAPRAAKLSASRISGPLPTVP